MYVGLDREHNHTSYRWLIVAMLFLVTAHNYLSRIALSVLVPVLRDDLSLTDMQYSYILSVFQFAYMFGMLAAGAFIDRIGTKRGYLILLGGWSFSALMHGTSGTSWMLGFWRGLLGITEAGNFPAAVKSVSEWFPLKERAFATSLFNSGPHVAMVAGPPLIVFLNLMYGWRLAFIVIGILGFVLVLLWPFLYHNPSANKRKDRYRPNREIKWRHALKLKETYGIMAGKFLTDPVWWFYIFWLPNYLNTQRGFNLKAIGWSIPVIYAGAVIMGIIGGWLPGWFIQKGVTVGKARKMTMAFSACLMPLTIFAVTVNSPWAVIALVSLACGAHSAWSNNIFTLVSDCFPSEAVGSVTGLGGFSGAVGGFLISTFAVGFIVTYAGYLPVFILMGFLHPLAFACVYFLVRPSSADY